MNVLYEEEGEYKAGAVLSQSPASYQVESPHGRRSKIKAAHVVFTFEHFNTGQPDGVARLYLDGQFAGALPPRTQTFTWDARQSSIMLGLGYIGFFDELSWFNRALTETEIRQLHELPEGVPSLLR